MSPNSFPSTGRPFTTTTPEFYGRVPGLKGLERSVVILCVNGFKDMARAPEQLHVGLSRAHCLLMVVGNQNLIAEAGGRELELALRRVETWVSDF